MAQNIQGLKVGDKVRILSVHKWDAYYHRRSGMIGKVVKIEGINQRSNNAGNGHLGMDTTDPNVNDHFGLSFYGVKVKKIK